MIEKLVYWLSWKKNSNVVYNEYRELDDYEIRIINEKTMHIENVILEKSEQFDTNLKLTSLLISITWNYQVNFS
jgi:hypothetical protein